MEKTKYCFHPAHQKLAHLFTKYGNLAEMYKKISLEDFEDLEYCLRRNSEMIRTLDELKSLAFLAHQTNDTEWLREICREIDTLGPAFSMLTDVKRIKKELDRRGTE
ncbi:DUF7667 family protein [Paenibacillus larvae]|uniref:Uncharacterized protein n=1 Tax=Paenibacillus larvae TaxID=1464 RepID=A0AAP5JSS3_9BACL|nr:hypothetical protein [Paenibacillus larvae]ETK29790.1 hypothetical protein ERIC1_1c33490 [Paenibacillus larvae subsp. larvae DSM 25719]MCY9688868.1 hypothetical protein [Paenibacillus larvae]MCY9709910.1 hypothetical protein [Paenibacillus larvae]MCY9718925.1 hypothetical protein [Paenibacillus larvae]MDT2173387.1 hypothetical protein [Paenibacillus larvae]